MAEFPQHELEHIAAHVAVMVTSCTRDLRYRFVNHACADFLGRAREDIVGHTIEEVVGKEALSVMQPYIERVLRGERVEYETEIAYRSTGARTMKVVYVPERDAQDAVTGWIAAVSDVSEHVRIERELRDADQRKDDFLATLAHELRNPLGPIRNSLELLRRAKHEPGAVTRAQATIERQVASLTRMIDDLLDVSRIAQERLELRRDWLPLGAVLRDAVEAIRPLADELGHELSLELPAEPGHVYADRVRLAQVLANLLSNACKYTRPRGTIAVTLERGADLVHISVKDSGIGIAPEKLAEVFDKFVQLEGSERRSRGGLGLGLHLVKQLVELHGGRVVARSEGPRRGSEFVVSLPAGEPSLAERDELEHALGTKALRVLVVDDEPDIADTLASLLRMAGHQVEVARDGEAGVALADLFHPDVVLLDLGLPRMSGLEACRAIRGQRWGRDVTIAALTAWGQDEVRRLARDAGFDLHLVKPIDYATLREVLEDASRA